MSTFCETMSDIVSIVPSKTIFSNINNNYKIHMLAMKQGEVTKPQQQDTLGLRFFFSFNFKTTNIIVKYYF